jgi:hypothetical protein
MKTKKTPKNKAKKIRDIETKDETKDTKDRIRKITDKIKETIVNKEDSVKKEDMAKIDKWEIFNHIKEESIRDPLYFTKILVHAFGQNLVSYIIRIAIYVLIVYPALTSIFHLSQGIATLFVIIGVVIYYSAITIYNKIAHQIKDNGKIKK